jgi:hypothetical protein
VAYIAHWSLLEGRIPGGDSGLGFGVLWGLYGVVAGLGTAILNARVRAKPGKSAIGVRAEAAIWHSTGLAIGAIVIGSIGRMIYEQDTTAPNVIMGAALALFGAALTGTAILSGQKWLTGFALASFAAALALGVFANAPWAYLYLSTASPAPFVELKAKVNATDGNLSTHLAKLEEAGYVRSEKKFIDKKPRTLVHLTAAGRKAWIAYLDKLQTLIASAE